jgi:esterase/lipase superfamily enzyme
VVFVSQNDLALEISGLVNGRPQRLGRESDIERLRDYPLLVIDVTEFSDGRNADHFTVGSSAELMEFLSNPELEREMNSQVFGSDELRASGQFIGATAKRVEKAVQWILFPNSQSD